MHIYQGGLPTRALNLVQEWLQAHRQEVLNIWNTQQFKKIPPLD